jgi:hypothetical protein
MEGSLFNPPGANLENSEQPCPECGQPFRPRLVGDGVDELCDTCYDAQFEPLHIAKWQKLARRRPPMRLPSSGRSRRAHQSDF